MKKFMMICMAVAMIATAKAEETTPNAAIEAQEVEVVNFHFRVHLTDMRKAMNLEEAQVLEVQKITRDLTRRIAHLEQIAVESRRAMLSSIIADNLSSMRKVTTGTQYHIYLNLFNTEFNKAGLNTILYDYDVAVN